MNKFRLIVAVILLSSGVLGVVVADVAPPDPTLVPGPLGLHKCIPSAVDCDDIAFPCTFLDEGVDCIKCSSGSANDRFCAKSTSQSCGYTNVSTCGTKMEGTCTVTGNCSAGGNVGVCKVAHCL